MNRSSLSSPLPWLIFAIAAGTRLSGLDLDGLDHDELWTANLLLQPIGDQLYALWRDTHPPLPHLLLVLWSALFGISEPALRVLPALMGIAAVVVAYVELAPRVGRTAATVVALCIALLPGHIYYSQETRNYAQAFLATTWVCTRLLAYIDTGGARRERILLAIACGLLLFSHYGGALTITATMLAALLCVGGSARERMRRVLVLGLTTFAICAPVLPHLIATKLIYATNFYSQPMTWPAVRGYLTIPFWWGQLSGLVFGVGLLLSLLLALLPRHRARLGALALLWWLPFAVVMIVSATSKQGLLNHRLAIVLAPPAIIAIVLASLSLFDGQPERRRRIAAAMVALLASALSVARLVEVDFYSVSKRDQVRRLAARVRAVSKDGDRVISIDPIWMLLGGRMHYYFTRHGMAYPIPLRSYSRGVGGPPLPKAIAQARRDHKRRLVIVAGRRPMHEGRVERALLSAGARLVHHESYRPRHVTMYLAVFEL
ncbi:MAG: glycosyltransferase family 39 protein [Myxococcales bacterium]|nr:glycosyltransferase family 39 protein [Myxococcales bacterium]